MGEPLKSTVLMLLQVLGGRFLPHQIPGLKNYCKFWGNIFTPSYSGFKKLLQVLGEPLKSRAFKINGSDAIASFGGEFSPHQIPDLKSYCKFWGRIFTPSYSGFKKLLQVLGGNFCKFWGARKINGSGLLQVLGENFYPIKFLV